MPVSSRLSTALLTYCLLITQSNRALHTVYAWRRFSVYCIPSVFYGTSRLLPRVRICTSHTLANCTQSADFSPLVNEQRAIYSVYLFRHRDTLNTHEESTIFCLGPILFIYRTKVALTVSTRRLLSRPSVRFVEEGGLEPPSSSPCS